MGIEYSVTVKWEADEFPTKTAEINFCRSVSVTLEIIRVAANNDKPEECLPKQLLNDFLTFIGVFMSTLSRRQIIQVGFAFGAICGDSIVHADSEKEETLSLE